MFGLAAAIAVATSVAISWWLAQLIAQPVRRISRAAEAMGRGELRQSLPEAGNLEFALLAQSESPDAPRNTRSWTWPSSCAR
ncbi:MAG TPA: HAMP domain-containing protein [Chloroflexota bacterium]|nr:HAMP domain-containing protein [Chloroflexota bacterium]